MAAAYWLIACCRGAITSLVVYVEAHQRILSHADQRMWVMWCVSGMVLRAECFLLNLELRHQVEEQQHQVEAPPGKFLVALIMVEWLLAFITLGMALSALVRDLAASPMHDMYQLAADVMACGSGALIVAATAVGLLCVLRSRFLLTQVPPQGQA